MKYYHPVLFVLLLFLTFAWLYLYWYRKNYGTNTNEGFQQERAFSSKMGPDIYDSFYTEIYDELMLSDLRAQDLFDAIVHVSQPTLRYSTFLDVGCGTGSMLERLDSAGYRATGIDRALDMVKFCRQKVLHSPNISIVHGDVLDSMQFDRAQFSHIICDGMTFYEWNDVDKLKFFRNCYFWTVAGGYLFLHVVDPLKFSPVALAAVDSSMSRFSTRSEKSRITDTDIDFLDFTYRSNYSFDAYDNSADDTSKCNCVTKRETFTDFKTQHVRENEIVLYISPIDLVVSLALRSGFLVKAKWNLAGSPHADAYQYVYMLERTL